MDSQPNLQLRPRMVLRNRYLLMSDLVLTPVSVALAFLIRFEEWRLWDFAYTQQLLVMTVLALLIKPLIYYATGLYSQVWRYGGRREAITITVAVCSASAVLVAAIVGLLLPQGLGSHLQLVQRGEFPRSVLVIDWLLSVVMVSVIRAAVRLFPPHSQSARAVALQKRQDQAKRILVVGAGEAGAKVIDEILGNPGLGLKPVGFVDDDPGKRNMFVHGVRVLGGRTDIPAIVQRLGVDEVIVALPTAPGKQIRSIVQVCEEVPVQCGVLPGLFELVNGQVSVRQVREPSIQDILRRKAIDLGTANGLDYLSGARVLVTGAGGSIGSELCRQVAAHDISHLVLLGHGENSIYIINSELARKFPKTRITPVIADIKSKERIDQVFADYRPDIVFHAAAHKHVPLMETNVGEAVENNIFGTENVLEASLRTGVDRFVFISSDKAVNPASILGVTKRVGELLVHQASRRDGGKYVSVRFGNVLASRGSVVPLFLAQIAAGGPVTVTHPQATRFFMTASEAVHLILHAAALSSGGDTFVLDMGDPVRIDDLARDLIGLRGLGASRDIEIVYTGLRPGEKLHEELFSEKEVPSPSDNPSILVAVGNGLDRFELVRGLRDLRLVVHTGSSASIKDRLRAIVPEYQSEESILHEASSVSSR